MKTQKNFLMVIVMLAMGCVLATNVQAAYYTTTCKAPQPGENGEYLTVKTADGSTIQYKKSRRCFRCNPLTNPPHCQELYNIENLSCTEQAGIANLSADGTVQKFEDPYECPWLRDAVHPVFLRKIANDPAILNPKEEFFGKADPAFLKLNTLTTGGVAPVSNYRDDQTAGLYIGTNEKIEQALQTIADDIKLRLVE